MPAYEAALEYVADGWAIVPIPPNSKGPRTPGWNAVENLITTADNAVFWKERPLWNMGVQLEASGLVSIDIDSVEYTRILFAEFGLDYDSIFGDAPHIRGNPEHDKILFRAPEEVPLKAHSVRWPDRDTKKPTTVIEFRAGAVQDVIPPSRHPSGFDYRWEGDFRNIPSLPGILCEIWENWDDYGKQFQTACPWAPKHLPRSFSKSVGAGETDIIGRFNSENRVEDILSRAGYSRVSNFRYLSPFSKTKIPGVIVFSDKNRAYTHHASDPFSDGYSHDAFDLYCLFEHDSSVPRAIRCLKEEYNIVSTEEIVGSKCSKNLLKSQDERVTTIPGVLGEVVKYYNQVSLYDQPHFAVSTALMIGSVVMGRRFRTDQNNYSSLYMLNIGKSSTGKDAAHMVIAGLLRKADLYDTLMGPGYYTSPGSLFSALKKWPCHIAIADEFGKTLEAIKKGSNANDSKLESAILDMFSRFGSEISAEQYSTMTLGQKQIAELDSKSRAIHPAVTILGMATPSTLYENLKISNITSGYLPRFIVVESKLERIRPRKIADDPIVSQDLIDWMRTCATTVGGDAGNLSDVTTMLIAPEPHIVRIDDDAFDLGLVFADEIIERSNALEKHGIDVLWGKSREISMRVALIIAVSCGHDTVRKEDMAWAIDYVRYHFERVTCAVLENISDSDFGATCQEVIKVIRAAGSRGATRREIARGSSRYRGSEPRIRDACLTAVCEDYDIELRQIQSDGAGRPRNAYVEIS